MTNMQRRQTGPCTLTLNMSLPTRFAVGLVVISLALACLFPGFPADAPPPPTAPTTAATPPPYQLTEPERFVGCTLRRDISRLCAHTDDIFTALLLTGRKKSHQLLIVELGSYDGAEATLAATLGYRVVVLEPSKQRYKKIRSKLLPRFSNSVEVWKVAATNASRTLRFARRDSTLDGVVADTTTTNLMGTVKFKAKSIDMVEGRRIDSIVLDSAHILKIDVQGHELQALQGATALLERGVDIVMVEFWPRALTTEGAVAVLSLLCRYNYTLYYNEYAVLVAPPPPAKWYPLITFPEEWVERSPVAYDAFVDSMNERTAKLLDQGSRDFGTWTDIFALSPKVKASYVEDAIINARTTTKTRGRMCGPLYKGT